MKHTLLIISLLILSVGFSQQKKSDEPNPMKGVKTQTRLEYNYEEKFGEFKEYLVSKTLRNYVKNGNLSDRYEYGSDGKLNTKIIYKYDPRC